MNRSTAYRRDLLAYGLGLLSALLLTAAAFALVQWPTFSTNGLLTGIYVLGLLQIIAHFRFFLHIGWTKSKREDLQLLLFSSLIILLMVAGTVAVLANLRMRMMP
ncbi:MAG: cytochrome-c oxidase [Proteobacteria bacterium]|nr:cytochrome-c oxidase [Pseudomonadota bacterium]